MKPIRRVQSWNKGSQNQEENQSSYISPSRHKMAPYLTVYFNKTETITPDAEVFSWPQNGLNPDLNDQYTYGLWRFSQSATSANTYYIGESTEWMPSLVNQARIDSTELTASGLFSSCAKIIRGVYGGCRLSSTVFPPTNKTISQMWNMYDPTEITVEWFFKPIDAYANNRYCIFSRGNHTYYNGSQSPLIINALYGSISGSTITKFTTIELAWASNNTTGGNFFSPEQPVYRYQIPNNITGGELIFGEWYHIALVKKGAYKLTMYLNGKEIFSRNDMDDYNFWATSGENRPEINLMPTQPLSIGDYGATCLIDSLRVVCDTVYITEFPNPVLGSDLPSSFNI